MPENTPPRLYVDANVLLSYVNQIPDRMKDLDPLLDDGRKGDVELLTSAVSIVEVAFAKTEQDGRVLDPDVDDKIVRLWRPPAVLRLVDFHELIGERAKAFMRSGVERGWSLKPMDAIHLGTAQMMRAVTFYTYDERLEKFAELLGSPIKAPLADKPYLGLA